MNDQPKDGGPAWPTRKPEWVKKAVGSSCDGLGRSEPIFQSFLELPETPGMSLRDWFAGQALAAMISKAPLFDRQGEYGPAVEDFEQLRLDMGASAYAYADAMLEARK